MTKKFIDPRTGKPTTKNALRKQLEAEKGKLDDFKTVMGSFAQCIKVAAYLNALGLDPVLPHVKGQKFYGEIPLWETASLDKNGCPTITFKKNEIKERKVWQFMDADDECLFLGCDGWDLVTVARTHHEKTIQNPDSEPYPNLTEKEFQHWVDLICAAPKLLQEAQKALTLLTSKDCNNPIMQKMVAKDLQRAIGLTVENTKKWKG